MLHPFYINKKTGDKIMETDLAKFAEENGVKYFMISFTDLFGGQRAKLVPARAIADMQKTVLVLLVLLRGSTSRLLILIC